MSIKSAFRPLPWTLCAALGMMAFILKFCLPGYSFSALVCCFLIAILAFYEVTRMLRILGIRPKAIGLVRRSFTLCLCLGLLVVGITEAIIIQASFGSPQEPVDYVVVLGAKVRTTGPSASLWDRIYAAAEYMAAHPDAVAVVSGGQGPDEPAAEGYAMFQELVRLGIEPERILVEERATSTWENLNFSLDLIEAWSGQRPHKLGVISSEYHLFRASLFAKACGVEFVGIPARTSRPSQMVNHFMREVAGVWHFWILGGQYQ